MVNSFTCRTEWDSVVNAATLELAQALIEPASVEEISYILLEHAKRITGSAFGYVGYIDPDTGYLISSTLTKDIWEDCQVPNKDFVFEEFGGLWGWVLENREPLLTNSPSDDLRSSGVPEGHLPVNRFLSVPAMVGKQLVGQVSLANPGRDYVERDLELVEHLASLYALAVQRQWREDEHRRIRSMLLQKVDQLARSNAELQHFARAASHDLREPLRVVINYIQLLERRYVDQLDAEAQKLIGYVVDGAERMQELVKGLSVYSRLDEQGNLPKRPLDSMDCEEVLEQVIWGLQSEIEESGALITHDPLPTIEVEGFRLKEVFRNLLDNAIKFRRKETRPRVHVSAKRGDGEWEFSIRDNGIGIAPEYVERVFGVFQRLHTRDKYVGAGIGLALCRKIVEGWGGKIWAVSELGEGATFYFTVPVSNSL